VGEVYLEMTKGFEYEPIRQKLEIKPGQEGDIFCYLATDPGIVGILLIRKLVSVNFSHGATS